MRLAGIPVVVAVNRFANDHDAELDFVLRRSLELGADAAAISDVHTHGGAGGSDLAQAVVRAASKASTMKFLYPADASIKEKIEILARDVYGADGVEYAPEANRKIKLYTELGYGHLPICMAKTHLSLSHDPNLKGVPRDFQFPIRDVRLSAGAGFLYPLAGEMQTMPGLGSDPAAVRVDLNEHNEIVGLF